ncbi:hypothetical protein RclHR1_07730010 [Rhizophagus clarus]|uniref:Crinkler effector protein N-terminal domain-containing protein n=1 Tax=Rhizophagus clarus TaxID=94130 RepID=A0A2Z6SLN0_9GLOM|nr:hypothetical protein RclHR1_07730010 [Rhizophagus clarus]
MVNLSVRPIWLPYENFFPVDIDTNKTVGHLKDAIKEKLTIMLRQKTLSYGRFTLSSELELVNTKINVNIKEDLGVEELPPLSKISKHFTSQPADEHICIIVQRPVETKEVYCNSRFRTSFTFPDGTGDEHIVINRECGGNEKEIIYLVDDEDLTGVIWTQGLKVDLPIVVDTCTPHGAEFHDIFNSAQNSILILPKIKARPF